jgi:hypothetical protein
VRTGPYTAVRLTSDSDYETLKAINPSSFHRSGGKASVMARLWLIAQLPPCLRNTMLAYSGGTPHFLNSPYRFFACFHCLQIKARSRRLIHPSIARQIEGVSMCPK